MSWLAFIGGAIFGGTIGVFAMCIVQVNRLHDTEE